MVSGAERHSWQQQATDLSAENLSTFGATVVVAPHPDDESLGCGGTIALLRKADLPVHVIFVSDGTLSHPNSKKYPAEKLRQLRETEALNALKILGVAAADTTFMRIKDRSVPHTGDAGFDAAAAGMRQLFDQLKPDTILVTWQKDPHPDHQASWQMVSRAALHLQKKPRILQYLIWIWELGRSSDLLINQHTKLYSIKIASVYQQKKTAIAAHVSQVSRLIDDDPDGFILSPQILAHFDFAEELFVEQQY